jgi:hypothetical protein
MLSACASAGSSLARLGSWETTGAVAIAAVFATLSLVFGALTLTERRQAMRAAMSLAARDQFEALANLHVPGPRIELAMLAALTTIPLSAAGTCIALWPDPSEEGRIFVFVARRSFVWVEAIQASVVLGLPLAVCIGVLVAWLAALRGRIAGLRRAGLAARRDPSPTHPTPYRGGSDPWARVQAWLAHPGPQPATAIALTFGAFVLVLLPAALGTFAFMAEQIDAVMAQPPALASRSDLQTGFGVAAAGLACWTLLALGARVAPMLRRYRLSGSWEVPTTRGRLRRPSLIAAIAAAAIGLAAQPLAAENRTPLEPPSPGLSYSGLSHIHGVSGIGPDLWADRTHIDASLRRVDGNPWNASSPLDEILCAKRDLWARMHADAPYPDEVNLTCEPSEPMVLVRPSLEALFRTGHRDVSLVWVDRSPLDRPILSLQRVRLTSTKMELVAAGEEGALDPAMFTTCRAFARALLERRRGGARVTVMVSPSDRSLDLRRPWRIQERCFP